MKALGHATHFLYQLSYGLDISLRILLNSQRSLRQFDRSLTWEVKLFFLFGQCMRLAVLDPIECGASLLVQDGLKMWCLEQYIFGWLNK